MVTAFHYLYPWDVLGDPGAIGRLLDADVRRVALAVAYHSVRAATPSHPQHRHVVLPRTSVLLPASAIYPDGLTPAHAPEHDWRRAADALDDAGIDVSGWAALTHVDGLDDRSKARRVNAFGDVLDFALCPNAPIARSYVETLLAEISTAVDGTALILEAVGPLGWQHPVGHDKTMGRSSTVTDTLLSLCFCAHCTAAMHGGGIDSQAVRQRIRTSCSADTSGPASVSDVLQHDESGLQELHLRTAADALAHVRGLASVTLSVHATAGDPWYTGPSVAVDLADDLDDVTLIASAWDGVEAAGRRGTALAEKHGGSRRGAYHLLLGAEPTDAAKQAAQLIEHGFDELHLYHFGLLTHHERTGLAAIPASASRRKETR